MENLYNVGIGTSSVAFTPDGRGLLSGGLNNVQYWDVSCLADGPDGHPNSLGVSTRDPLNETKETSRNSTCTMSLIGHKVRVYVEWVDLGRIRSFGAGDCSFRCCLARRPMVCERIRRPGSSILECEVWDRPVDIEGPQGDFRSVVPVQPDLLEPFRG